MPGLTGNLNLALPGLPSLPPLDFSSSARSSTDQSRSSFSASGAGDWNVNLGGTNAPPQNTVSAALAPITSNMPIILIVGAALGALWLLKKN